MHLLSIFLIGIAANIDNLGISVSYGIRTTRIPFVSNLMIAIASMICAFLSIIAGKLISHFISINLANFIGGLIIFSLGIKCMVDSFSKRNPPHAAKDVSRFKRVLSNPDSADVNNDHIISIKESVMLGFALAINCLAMGLGAGITGVSPVLTTLSIGFFSLLFIWCGEKLGYMICNKDIGKYSALFAGILLVLIGIYEMIV
jgi:putative sporulation protein YtaF